MNSVIIINALASIFASSLCYVAGAADLCTQAGRSKAVGLASSRLRARGYNAYTSSPQNKTYDVAFFPPNQTAFGANPSALFATPRIGAWASGDSRLPGDTSVLDMLFTLESQEAIVSVLCTPPKVKLFTWETFLLARLSWPLKYIVPGPGAPISSVINSVNLGDSPFNRSLVIVTTADSRTAEAVKAAFNDDDDVDVVVNAINGTSQTLHFAKTANHPIMERDDLFQSLLQIYPEADNDISWYAQQRFPILRVLPTMPAPDSPLYPVPPRPLAFGPGNESGLTTLLATLRDRVVKTFGTRGMQLSQMVNFHAVELNKTRCATDPTYKPWALARGCLGTSSDGRYSLSDKDITVEKDHVVIVLGVNHVSSGHALDAQLLAGTKVCVLSDDLSGSAARYLDGVPSADQAKMFAFAFASDCSQAGHGQFCAQVKGFLGGKAQVGLRYQAYLEPAFGARPSQGLVQPIALVFTMKTGLNLFV